MQLVVLVGGPLQTDYQEAILVEIAALHVGLVEQNYCLPLGWLAVPLDLLVGGPLQTDYQEAILVETAALHVGLVEILGSLHVPLQPSDCR